MHGRRASSNWHAVFNPEWVAFIAVVSTLVCALAFVDWRGTLVRQSAEEASVAALAVQTASSPSPPTPSSDFSATLPPRPDLSAFLSELRRSTSDLGIVVDSIQVLERPLDPSQLSRIDLSVRLRGTYPSLKAVLRDVTDRLPAATISHVRFRRVAPGLAEASVLFGTWSSAATAGAVVK